MHLDEARRELRQILRHTGDGPAERLPAARRLLVAYGAEALGLAPTAAASLADLIKAAANAERSDARRAFAVLLVDALGIPGLVRSRARTAEFDRDICAFLENALLNPLRRAGYPFAGPVYDKLRCLEALHATIDEHMKPLEPTFPPWLSGLPVRKG